MSRLALCDVVGPLNDLNQKLAGQDGGQWLGHLKKMLRGELVAVEPPAVEAQPVPPILKLVASGVKVAGAKRFVADKVSLKEANIGFTWSDFDNFFLGKVEENIQDATIAIHRLEKNSLDAPIRKELGQEREEITLTHFFDLLKKQSKGQEGHLLVNGYANIAYIRDKHDKLWAVRALWPSYYRYWDVRAHSVVHPYEWGAGDQVLSSELS